MAGIICPLSSGVCVHVCESDKKMWPMDELRRRVENKDRIGGNREGGGEAGVNRAGLNRSREIDAFIVSPLYSKLVI